MPTAKNNTMPPKPQAPKEMKFSAAIEGPMNPKRKKVCYAAQQRVSLQWVVWAAVLLSLQWAVWAVLLPPMPPKPPMGGGMGMPPKPQPRPMPGMKSGGKVKKYNKGGKVRGAGIAKKGVRKCKMR